MACRFSPSHNLSQPLPPPFRIVITSQTHLPQHPTSIATYQPLPHLLSLQTFHLQIPTNFHPMIKSHPPSSFSLLLKLPSYLRASSLCIMLYNTSRRKTSNIVSATTTMPPHFHSTFAQHMLTMTTNFSTITSTPSNFPNRSRNNSSNLHNSHPSHDNYPSSLHAAHTSATSTFAPLS